MIWLCISVITYPYPRYLYSFVIKSYLQTSCFASIWVYTMLNITMMKSREFVCDNDHHWFRQFFFHLTAVIDMDARAHSLCSFSDHVNGLAQECGNSIAIALELPQSCAKPLMWGWSANVGRYKVCNIFSHRLTSCIVCICHHDIDGFQSLETSPIAD